MQQNGDLDFYLVTPNGKLWVQHQRDDDGSKVLLLEGLNIGKAIPHLKNIKGPNKSTDDLKPVDDDDPIGGVYDPNIYRPPGYDNPMQPPCIGCQGNNITPSKLKDDKKYETYSRRL